MNPYTESRFCSFVDLLALIVGTIGKKCTCNTLSDISVLIILKNTVFFIIHINLNSFHQPSELFFDVPCLFERSLLDKILCAPLITIVILFPLVVHIEESQVVTTRSEKCLFCIIGMHFFVFRPEKYTISN